MKFFWKKIEYEIISLAVTFVYLLISFTCRKKRINEEALKKASQIHPSGAFIYAFWHRHAFSALALHKGRKISPMVSASKDGELAARISKMIGFVAVRGSSGKNGKDAQSNLREMVRLGYCAAYTVDGPRGPVFKAKSGAIALSRDEQIPILPMVCFASRRWVLHRSWDKFVIPKLFCTMTVIYGEPFLVDGSLQGEDFLNKKNELSEILLELEQRSIAE